MDKDELTQSGRRSFTRLARFINQLLREQCSGCPVTVQQCYALEALMDGPLSMNALAAEVALHQSTLTRIVAKLEKQDLLRRSRRADNQRTVDVEITDAGRETYRLMKRLSSQMIAGLLDLVPEDKRLAVVSSMEILADLLDPRSEGFQELLRNCCAGACDEGCEE